MKGRFVITLRKVFSKDEMSEDLEFVRARVGDKDGAIECLSIRHASPAHYHIHQVGKEHILRVAAFPAARLPRLEESEAMSAELLTHFVRMLTPGANSGAAPRREDRGMADIVFYSIGVDRPITPTEPLPAPPPIPRGALVVVEGRAPVWRYGLAFHPPHGSPAGAVAVYDPRLGAVIVASHRPEWAEGQVLEVEPPNGPAP
jgi:CRISPR-associated protein Csx3